MRTFTLIPLVLTALLASPLPVPGQRAVTGRGQIGDFDPGYVGSAGLRYYSTARLDMACDLLQKREFAQAMPLFQKEVDQHPDDLAAWVGLMQCSRDAWPGELLSLEDETRKGASDPITRFKLATLLYYQWAIQEPGRPRTYPDAQRDRAMGLLESVWKSHKMPLAGMMLCQVYSTMTGPYGSNRASTIGETLLRDLAGPDAYKQYEEASKKGWPMPPPSASLTPPANRRSLVAPISLLYQRAGARPMKPVYSGSRVIRWEEAPMNSAAEAKTRWLFQWIASLKSNLGDHTRR